MIRHLLVLVWRNLRRDTLTNAINLFGLTVGFLSALCIAVFILSETSFDRWLEDADRIFRIESTIHTPGREPSESARAPGILGDAFRQDFAGQYEAFTQINRPPQTIVIRGDAAFKERVALVDESFFEIFDLPEVAGNRDAVLNDNLSLVLSESTARKYFGDEDPIGQSLKLRFQLYEATYTVAGVVADVPNRSHIDFDLIVRFEPERFTAVPGVMGRWDFRTMNTYVKLARGADVSSLADQMAGFIDRRASFHSSGLAALKPSSVLEFHFVPMPDIHLHSTRPDSPSPPGDYGLVLTLALVAVLIIGIATINFINLSVARSQTRLKEIFLRRILGAERGQIALLYVFEATLFVALAMVAALTVGEAIHPWFATLVDLPAGESILHNWRILAGAALVIAVVGGASGAYPGYVVSKGLFAEAFSTKTTADVGPGFARYLLVVIQFAISVGLIIVAGIIFAQSNFGRTIETGYATSGRVVISGLRSAATMGMGPQLRRRILQIPEVRHATLSADILPRQFSFNTQVGAPWMAPGEQVSLESLGVGLDFFETYDIAPLAGRLFSEDFPADEVTYTFRDVQGNGRGSAILTASTASALGFADVGEALGKTLTQDVLVDPKPQLTIVGIVPDMIARSVRFPVSPIIFTRSTQLSGFLTIQFQPGMESAGIEQVRGVWKDMFPESPIELTSLEEEFDAIYGPDEARGKLLAAFAILAVGVSALGLYGLASFVALQRKREIGIRKVLGARIQDIIRLLVWQFTKPVFAANLVAWPLAGVYAQNWLSGFAHRIDLGPAIFVLAGLGALAVAWLAVATHAFRAARMNPALVLRDE